MPTLDSTLYPAVTATPCSTCGALVGKRCIGRDIDAMYWPRRSVHLSRYDAWVADHRPAPALGMGEE